MLAIEIGIGVHHLRLHPQAKVHAQRAHFVDERLEAIGKLLLVHVPIAQAGVVGFALAKPAVVHHKAVNAQRRGLLRQSNLSGLGYVHLGGFPRVVDDGARLWRGVVAITHAMRQDVRQLVVMQQTRGAAQAVRGEAAVEDGRFKGLARRQHVAKVEGIEAAGHTNRVQLILLNGEAPGAAPTQRAEPDFAAVFVGRAGLNGKPGIGLVAGGAAAALDDARAGMQRLLGQRPLACPAAGEVIQRVVACG